MTTPRIEEKVEEFEKQMPLMRAHGKLLCATASPTTYKKIKDWLRKALTQAHQAGIDEAVEVIKEELRNAPLEVQMTKGVIFAKVIKALQDNK